MLGRNKYHASQEVNSADGRMLVGGSILHRRCQALQVVIPCLEDGLVEDDGG